MVKKAQAAMEFLMTYGWAILVVLAAIAALAYFGVLSPDRFLPEKCTLPAGTACLDFTATSTEINLRIQNSAGFDMNSIELRLEYDNGTSGPENIVCGPTDSDRIMTNGETKTWQCNATDGSSTSYGSGKMKGDINLTYTNQQTTMRHSKFGELIVQID